MGSWFDQFLKWEEVDLYDLYYPLGPWNSCSTVTNQTFTKSRVKGVSHKYMGLGAESDQWVFQGRSPPKLWL